MCWRMRTLLILTQPDGQNSGGFMDTYNLITIRLTGSSKRVSQQASNQP
jgi:hypothetical protein